MEYQTQETIQPNIETQISDQIQVKESKPKVNYWIISTISLIIVLILGSIVVWFSLLKQKYTQESTSLTSLVSPTEQPVQTLTPTLTQISIPSDWKTYTNKLADFSFQYPPIFTYLFENPDDLGVYIATSEGTGEGKGSPFGLDAQKDLWISAVAITLDNAGFEIWQEKINTNHNILIQDLNAYSGEIPIKEATEASYGYFVYVLKDNVLYQLNLMAKSKELGNSVNTRKIFDQILSTYQFTDEKVVEKQTNTPQVSGANLEEIKYVIPSNWEAELFENNLHLSPINTGGYLAISVYDYPSTIGRRAYYCQVRDVCLDTSYFTAINLGNISGYSAHGLDNSGGGTEYFGAKGNKFYVISSYSSPSPNDFDSYYQAVLDSLVF